MPLLSYNQHRMANGAESPTDKPRSGSGSREDTLTSVNEQNEALKQSEVVESKSKALLRDEFLINMQKFAIAISRTLQQIEGEVILSLCFTNKHCTGYDYEHVSWKKIVPDHIFFHAGFKYYY